MGTLLHKMLTSAASLLLILCSAAARPYSMSLANRAALPFGMLANRDAQDDEAYRPSFGHYDQDGDESITVDELLAVVEGSGRNTTRGEVEGWINDADSDGNGAIDFSEYVAMEQQDQTEETKMESFNFIDSNGDNEIDIDELRQALEIHNLGEKATLLMDYGDLNGDDQLDFEEYKALFYPTTTE